jgi:hypothetical protein
MAAHPYSRASDLPFSAALIDGAFLLALRTSPADSARSLLAAGYEQMVDHLLTDEEYTIIDKWRRFQAAYLQQPQAQDEAGFGRQALDAMSESRLIEIQSMLAERLRARSRIIDTLRE